MADLKRILVRRDTLANWQAANPTLGDGEMGWVSDTRDLVAGPGLFNDIWATAQSIPNRAKASADSAATSAANAATAATDALASDATVKQAAANAASTAVTNALAGKNVPIILTDAPLPDSAFTPDSKTVALYHLDNSPADSSGNGYTATTYGGTPVYTANAARFGGYGQASGVNRIPDAADAFIPVGSAAPDFTIDVWVRTTNSGNVMVAVGRASGYFLAIDTNGNAWAGITNPGGGTTNIVSTVKINDGNWHLLTLVIKSGQGSALWVDHVQAVSTTSVAQRGSNANSQLTIGAMGAAYIWQGDLDEVRLSNSARNPAVTRGYPPRPSGLIPGIVTYVGPSTPTDMLKGDAWRKVPA